MRLTPRQSRDYELACLRWNAANPGATTKEIESANTRLYREAIGVDPETGMPPRQKTNVNGPGLPQEGRMGADSGPGHTQDRIGRVRAILEDF